jgi:hypothetical protein
MADRMRMHLEDLGDFASLSDARKLKVRDKLKAFYSGQGFVIERKLARLTEKLKDAIEAGKFGPLFVDDEGNPIPTEIVNDPEAPGVNATQAYRIWRAFRNIYSLSVLDQVDEEGELVE